MNFCVPVSMDGVYIISPLWDSYYIKFAKKLLAISPTPRPQGWAL